MCGCPASCKLFSNASGMRSGAVMCQASNCGVNHTAGRHGDTRIRCKSTRRALSSWSLGAFPNPDQTDRLPLTSSKSPPPRSWSTGRPLPGCPTTSPAKRSAALAHVTLENCYQSALVANHAAKTGIVRGAL